MQVKPEYETVDDFSKIANKLVQKYPEMFYELDVKNIQCVAIINKERSEKRKIWEIKSVPMPIRMDCPYAYYVILWMSDWAEMEEKHKALLVADVLLSVPTDAAEEGKLNQFDLKDFDVMIRTLGVDYLIREDVPDVLKDTIEWARA